MQKRVCKEHPNPAFRLFIFNLGLMAATHRKQMLQRHFFQIVRDLLRELV